MDFILKVTDSFRDSKPQFALVDEDAYSIRTRRMALYIPQPISRIPIWVFGHFLQCGSHRIRGTCRQSRRFTPRLRVCQSTIPPIPT